MRRLLPPVLLAATVVAASCWGFRLRPDSASLAAGDVWYDVLPFLGMRLTGGGMAVLTAWAALGAALCYVLIPRGWPRLVWLLASGFWALFPGVDMMGCAAVLAAWRAYDDHAAGRGQHLTVALVVVAGLIHPPAGIAALPLLVGAPGLAAALSSLLLGYCCSGLAGIPAGALTWHFQYRYLLPGIALSLVVAAEGGRKFSVFGLLRRPPAAPVAPATGAGAAGERAV